MIVVHGLYVPAESAPTGGGGFLLWGEGATRVPCAEGAHPRALPAEELVSLLRSQVARPGGPARWRARRLHLTVPSCGPRPVPSAPALREGPDYDVELAPELRSFELEALLLAPTEALELLLSHLSTLQGTAAPARLTSGDDLDFWGEAARLAIDLLLRRRVAPTVDDGHARWRPVLCEPHERERLQRLAAAMPSVCRAASVGRDATLFPSSTAILRAFLDEFVDAASRDLLRSVLPAERRRAPAGPEGHLVASLALPHERDREPSGATSAIDPALAKRLHDWSLPLLEPLPEGELRLGLRLAAPPIGEDPPVWQLLYHLEAREDPSLQISALDVWSSKESSFRRLGRRFRNPQDTLLARLGGVASLCPPIARSLEERHPWAAELNLEEAHRFLAREAPLLAGASVAVYLPSDGRAMRVGLTLHASESGSRSGAAVTRFGLATLVDFDWRVAVGDVHLTVTEFEELAARKVPLVSVRGEWVLLDPESVEKTLKLLDRRPAGRTTLLDLLRLAGGLEAGPESHPIDSVTGEGWIGDLLSAARAQRDPTPFAPPASLTGTLRPYQVRGVAWLRFLLSRGLGACLADDMGLGKTVQFLATLLSAREAGEEIRPSLLVCPTSVAENWVREAARFAPTLTVAVHHGPERESGEAFHQLLQTTDLLVTTYALAHRDRALLGSLTWEYLALDEAQNVKNPAAAQSRAVRALKARRRAALTGTPIENRLSELKSLFDVLSPGLLGTDETFRSELAVPIERRRDDAAAERLRRITGPFLLRRAKTDEGVAQDLPEKIETKEHVGLTKEQASLYRAATKSLLSGIGQASGRSRRAKVLLLLLRLKQICNHPALFLGDRGRLADRSAKLTRLLELLDETLAEKRPSLLFTQFAEMGHILVQALKERFSCEVLFLHGAVPRRARDEMVRRFQEDDEPPLFFVLSLKAGGSGLNLTRASHVFHVDRWWNPAVEDQATDRAFRIGQRRNVQVHKFVCRGTLEERIDGMIEEKKDLARTIIGTGETWLTEMSDLELERLVALSPEAVDAVGRSR